MRKEWLGTRNSPTYYRKIIVSFLFLIVSLSLLSVSGKCVKLTNYEIGVEIEGKIAKNKISMEIENQTFKTFQFALPESVKNLRIWDEDGDLLCNISKSEVECGLKQCDKYTLFISYDTTASVKEEKEYTAFSTKFPVFLPAKSILLDLRLPEGMGLVSVDNTSITNIQPCYPTNCIKSSDGRRIRLVWVFNDVEKGDIAVSATYENINRIVYPELFPFIIGLAMVIIAVLIILLIKKGKKMVKHENSLESIRPILKEDENKIIDCLIENKGEIIQRKIVKMTDFSKAKVSRLLSGFKERGLVKLEKRGRTNKVYLLMKPSEPYGTIKKENTPSNEQKELQENNKKTVS